MTGKRFVGFAATLMAMALCINGCAAEGIDSRRRDGVFTVSHQAEASASVQESQLEESRPTEEQPEGQLESPSEGRSEGQTDDQTENQPESQNEEQTEGPPESQNEGQTEGTPGGQMEGQPEGQIAGQSEEQAEGQTEGQPEGQVEGQEEGQTEDQPEGQPEAQPESQGLETVIGTSGVNIEELNMKDDTRLVAGYDPDDRDEQNRPNKAVNFQEIFGQYNCEFLHGEDQTIMLQFTIGVDNDTISPILDTLAARGIHAHFFVTGDYAKSHPDVIWRILGEGHILGNHSWAHPEEGMNALSTQEIIDDSMQMQNFIRETYGYEMREYAFPSGFFCERALATICQLGYHTVFYSFAYNDYMPSVEGDSQTALDRLLRELHPGAIYLLHGSSTMTAGILGTFLDEAAARGYSFVY